MKSLPFAPQSLVCCPQENVDTHLRCLIGGGGKDRQYLRKHLSPRALDVLQALERLCSSALNADADRSQLSEKIKPGLADHERTFITAQAQELNSARRSKSSVDLYQLPHRLHNDADIEMREMSAHASQNVAPGNSAVMNVASNMLSSTASMVDRTSNDTATTITANTTSNVDYVSLFDVNNNGQSAVDIASLRSLFRKRLHTNTLDQATIRTPSPSSPTSPRLGSFSQQLSSPQITSSSISSTTNANSFDLSSSDMALASAFAGMSLMGTFDSEPSASQEDLASINGSTREKYISAASLISSSSPMVTSSADVKWVDQPMGDSGADLSFHETSQVIDIPRFYFPFGKPRENERQYFCDLMTKVKPIFSESNNILSARKFRAITVTAMHLPIYANLSLLRKLNSIADAVPIQGAIEKQKEERYHSDDEDEQDHEYITYTDFVRAWKVLSSKYLNNTSLLFGIFKQSQNRNYLISSDFNNVLDDVLFNHPGLQCIRDQTDFQARYRETVLARFWYRQNLAQETMTLSQFRKSGFIHDLTCIDEQNDINAFRCLFSYNYFYVIYCKFIELDADKDGYIVPTDIARRYHANTIPLNLLYRITQGCGLGKYRKDARMPYKEFIWFLISDHDKQSITAREYWFMIFDLDSDGIITLWELEQFNTRRPLNMSQQDDNTDYRNDVCEFLDAVTTRKKDGLIYLSDVRKSKTVGLFYDFFVNHLNWDEWAARTTGGGLAIRTKKEFERREVKERLTALSQNLIDLDKSELSDFDHFIDQEFCLLIDEPQGQPMSDDEGSSSEDNETEIHDNGEEGIEDLESETRRSHRPHRHHDSQTEGANTHQENNIGADLYDSDDDDDSDDSDEGEDLDFFAPASSTAAVTTTSTDATPVDMDVDVESGDGIDRGARTQPQVLDEPARTRKRGGVVGLL